MYESPIELFDVASYTKKANEEIDNYIYEYIVKLGINVNKEELIKALQYDRDQYEKGYKDGQKEALKYVVCKAKEITVEGYLDESRQVIFTSYLTVDGLRSLGYDIIPINKEGEAE